MQVSCRSAALMPLNSRPPDFWPGVHRAG